jgi:DNA-binding response OmpR family regulator
MSERAFEVQRAELERWANAPAPETDAKARCPRVFLEDDGYFFRLSLSAILGRAGVEVFVRPRSESVEDALRALHSMPDLLIVAVQGPPLEAYDRLRRIRANGAPEEVPILGVTTLDRSGLDFEELRALGVVGLLDKSCRPEQIVFRVNEILRPRWVYARRHERAPVYFPVDLEAGGATTTEYAIDLSPGGMRVTSARPLDPNTDVCVRFRVESAWVDATARVANRRAAFDSSAPYEIGLFFQQIAPEAQILVSREVERSLAEARAAV